MKKFLSALVTAILAIAGLTLAAQPALAWTNPEGWGTGVAIDLTVGQYTVIDWSCGEYGVDNVYWDQGTLPDGLSIDSSGYVSGTPTTVGDTTLTGYHCHHGNQTGSLPYYTSVSLHVHLPASPTPTISLADLGDQNCSAEFVVSLPIAADPGSVSLLVSNGYNTATVALADIAPQTQVTIDQPIVNFGDIYQNPNVVSYSSGSNDPFRCGDYIQATLSYRGVGKATASASASQTIAGAFNPGNFHGGSLTVTNVNDAACTAHIAGYFDATADSNSPVVLTVGNGQGATFAWTLRSYSANEPISLDLSLNDFSTFVDGTNVLTSSGPSGVGTISCGDLITAEIEYTSNGDQGFIGDGLGATITAPDPNTPYISLSNANDSACHVHISGYFPGVLGINSVMTLAISNGSATRTWSLRNYSPNEQISLDLSLNDTSTFVDGTNVTGEFPPSGTGSLACGDTVTGSFTYYTGSQDLTGSDNRGVTITAPAPVTPAAHLNLSNADDSSCNLHISGSFDTTPDSGSTVNLTINNGSVFESWVLRSYSAGETISLDLSLNDISTFVDGVNVVSHGSPIGAGNLACGDTVYGQLDYNSGGTPTFGVDNTGVTVTQSSTPPPPPSTDYAADISATYVGGANCEVDITGSFNFDTDSGTAGIFVSNGDGGAVIAFNDMSADQTFSYHLQMNEPNSFGLDVTGLRGFVTTSLPNPIKCGDVLTFMAIASKDGVSYSHTTDPVVTVPQSHLSVTNLNDAMCDLHIVGTLPVAADTGTIYLDFSTETGTATAVMKDYQPGTLIDLTFSMNMWDFESSPYIQAYETSQGWSPECGDAMATTLSYFVNGVLSGPFTVSDVTATSPVPSNAAPTTSVTVIPSDQCLVVVSNYLTVPLDNPVLIIGDPQDNNNYTTINLSNLPVGRTFTVTVPMSQPTNTRSEFAGEIATTGHFHCGSRVVAAINGLYNNSPVSGTGSDPLTTELYCNLGNFQDDGACVPAERGYFVNAWNSRSEVQCPTGYTTPGIGATSLGDCYKVLLQTINKLTPPKAMKFNTVIALPIMTTANTQANVIASGSCTSAVVQPGNKVAGKKVKVPTLAVTSNSVAGTCVLNYVSQERGAYGTYSKTLTIKVNKKGK